MSIPEQSVIISDILTDLDTNATTVITVYNPEASTLDANHPETIVQQVSATSFIYPFATSGTINYKAPNFEYKNITSFDVLVRSIVNHLSYYTSQQYFGFMQTTAPQEIGDFGARNLNPISASWIMPEPNTAFDFSHNTYSLCCQVSGLYMFNYNTSLCFVPSYYYQQELVCCLVTSTSGNQASATCTITSGNAYAQFSGSMVINLNVGDYVYLAATNNSDDVRMICSTAQVNALRIGYT